MINRLKTYLDHHGMSQREFSRRYRISQPYLNQIITGKRKAGKEKARYLEVATEGYVKKSDLRPDIWSQT